MWMTRQDVKFSKTRGFIGEYDEKGEWASGLLLFHQYPRASIIFNHIMNLKLIKEKFGGLRSDI